MNQTVEEVFDAARAPSLSPLMLQRQFGDDLEYCREDDLMWETYCYVIWKDQCWKCEQEMTVRFDEGWSFVPSSKHTVVHSQVYQSLDL